MGQGTSAAEIAEGTGRVVHDECMAGTIPWNKTARPVDPERTLHESVLERLRLPAVRSFISYGPYRPANLEQHPQVRDFFVDNGTIA